MQQVKRKPMGRTALRIAHKQWRQRLRFRGSMGGFRQIKSEIHGLLMTKPAARRRRIAYLQALFFRWRLRGQYIPPLTLKS